MLFLQVQRSLSNDVKILREQLTQRLHIALDKTSVSCTIDIWTDKIRHFSYLGCTVHFAEVDENGTITLKSKMLGIKPFDAGETKNHQIIRELLWSILREFDLYTRREEINFVTDRGSNIVKSLRNYKRNNCIAHFVNNIAGAALGPVKKTIKKVSRIVKYLKVTGLNTLLEIRLTSYVPTRWNSVYQMLDTFLKCWSKIEEILSNRNNEFLQIFSRLSHSKLVAIRNYSELYNVLTTEIEGDLSVTSVKICPVVEYFISHNEIKDDDISIVKLMKKEGSKYFETNQNVIADNYVIYAFFNPLNKKFEAISHIDKKLAFSNILQILSEIEPGLEPDEIRNVNESFSGTGNSSILDIFNDKNMVQNLHCNDEFEKYLNYNVEKQFDLLEWWKDHKLIFPRLYNFFITIAGLPASSASCERLFSYASNFLTVKRNRMRNDTLEDLMFMYMNDEM